MKSENKESYSEGAKAQRLGKFGIKGNSGLGVLGLFHVSAPYDSNGKVFVARHFDRWERMSLSRAKKEKRVIISCSMCSNPAVSLDHLWPYHEEMNRCSKHYGKPYQGEKLRASAPSHEKLFDCIANQKTLTGYEPASPATVYLEPRKAKEAGK